MNKHLNPSPEEAQARLFITDNGSVIVIMALFPDFAIKERIYELKIYLNRDLQIKCPDVCTYLFNKVGECTEGMVVCLVCGSSVFSVILSLSM